MVIRGLRAGNRLAQRRLDRRPAGHGLQVPSEGYHVAPESVGKEQFRRCRGIVRLQRRLEGREPVFRVGLRRMTRAIVDQCHRQILLQRRRLHHARDAPDARIAKKTPGKAAIAVEKKEKLIPTIETVILAVEAGELDGVLAQMSKSSSQFVKGKRAA